MNRRAASDTEWFTEGVCVRALSAVGDCWCMCEFADEGIVEMIPLEMPALDAI